MPDRVDSSKSGEYFKQAMAKIVENIEISKKQVKIPVSSLRKKYEASTITEKSYTFRSRRKNPEYSDSKLEILRSCHIHNKASKNSEYLIKRIPKWITVLDCESADTETGEILYDLYETDDMKQAKGRKIKTIKKFCDFYQPLYSKRLVSVLFHTFTRINYSRNDMKTMLECVKSRYKSLGKPIRGYLWVLEISENNHAHYHLVIACDRIRVKAIPEELKMENLWGQRTGVEFIKKSVRNYLSKYLYESDGRLIGKRNYAISRNLR